MCVSTLIRWLASATLLSSLYGTRFTWLVITATLAPWFSLSAIFIVSILVVLILFKANITYWRRLTLCLPILISCMMSGIVVLLRSFSPVQKQLAGGFPVVPAVPNIFGYVGHFSDFFTRVFFCYFGFAKRPYVFWKFFGNEISLALLALIVLCSLGIMASFKRSGWSLALLLAGPLALACLLLLLKCYPTLGRSFLFGAPGLFLLMGFGLSYLYHWIKFQKLLIVLLILLILPVAEPFILITVFQSAE